MPITVPAFNSTAFFKNIFFAKWVIVQNKNKMVKPLANALIKFIPIAAFAGEKGDIKSLPINTKNGAPGECGICNL